MFDIAFFSNLSSFFDINVIILKDKIGIETKTEIGISLIFLRHDELQNSAGSSYSMTYKLKYFNFFPFTQSS